MYPTRTAEQGISVNASGFESTELSYVSVKFRYRNVVTGKYQNKQPNPIYGGLLTDVSSSMMLLYYRIQTDYLRIWASGRL